MVRKVFSRATFRRIRPACKALAAQPRRGAKQREEKDGGGEHDQGTGGQAWRQGAEDRARRSRDRPDRAGQENHPVEESVRNARRPPG